MKYFTRKSGSQRASRVWKIVIEPVIDDLPVLIFFDGVTYFHIALESRDDLRQLQSVVGQLAHTKVPA